MVLSTCEFLSFGLVIGGMKFFFSLANVPRSCFLYCLLISHIFFFEKV